MLQRFLYLWVLILAAMPSVQAQTTSTAVYDQLLAAGVSSGDAVTNTITQNPADAGAITRHAIQSNPENLPVIIEAAVKSNSDQVTTIIGAAFDEDPDQAVLVVTVATQAIPEKTPEILEYAMERYPWKFASMQNRSQIEWAQARKAAEAKFQQSLNPSASEAARINAKQQSQYNANNYVENITERNFRRSASPN